MESEFKSHLRNVLKVRAYLGASEMADGQSETFDAGLVPSGVISGFVEDFLAARVAAGALLPPAVSDVPGAQIAVIPAMRIVDVG